MNIIVEPKLAISDFSDFKVTLLTEYFEIPASINSIESKGKNLQISVSIPRDIPIELYNLRVDYPESVDIEERCIKTVEGHKDTFVFAHITDTHIGYGKEEEEVLAKVIEEINLINPEFVLITGDIIHNCENVGRALMLKAGKKVSDINTGQYKNLTKDKIKQACINEYKTFLKLLAKCRVPTYIIPGNHDMAGLYSEPSKKFYEEMIGKRYYSFDYGNCHFTGCDNSGMMEAAPILYPEVEYDLDEKQLAWLEEDLKRNENKKLKFVFFHCPIRREARRFRGLIIEYDVDMTLFGHLHFDKVNVYFEKPIWILTKSTISSHPGYRIIRIEDGKIASYSYYRDYRGSSMPYNQLNYEFKPANNGKNYEVSCYIKNGLEEKFNHAQLNFIMPRDANYEIVNAELMQKIITEDFKLIYANVHIPEEREVRVIVKRK